MISTRKSRSRQEPSFEINNEDSLESSQEFEKGSNESLSKPKSRLSKSSSNEKTVNLGIIVKILIIVSLFS